VENINEEIKKIRKLRKKKEMAKRIKNIKWNDDDEDDVELISFSLSLCMIVILLKIIMNWKYRNYDYYNYLGLTNQPVVYLLVDWSRERLCALN